jgi:hypothetical protein
MALHKATVGRFPTRRMNPGHKTAPRRVRRTTGPAKFEAGNAGAR